MSLKKAYLYVFVVLLIDQISKVYIKTNFFLNEEVEVFNWFRIHFIENEGMAWGFEIPGNYGKMILTIFRIFAVFGIAWWLQD
ncbi:MAG TPA: lipoprotein signal peptidase, partial [Flavobacterium sp.]|nr:lipoprotein signal peptidase [Flavobacterium sp.]